MIGAQAGNTNARKGKENRVRYTVRLPPEIIEFIREKAKYYNMSQADFLIWIIEEE